MERNRAKRDRSNRSTESAHGRIPGDGLCSGCLRDLFLYGLAGSRYCDQCRDAIAAHPGADIHALRNGRSERLPQERADRTATGWKPDGRCVGAPWELFEGRINQNAVIPRDEYDIARVFCAHCPVIEECSAYADAHEFVGIFGGYLRCYVGDGKGRPAVYKVRDLLGDLRPVPDDDRDDEDEAA